LFVLFVCVTVNTTNAAFPTGKQSAQTVVAGKSNLSSELKDSPASKSELNKEFSHLKKESRKGYGGGGKSKITAAILAFFLGWIGIHSFYMHQKKKGFIQLAMGVIGYVAYIAGAISATSGSGSISVLLILGLLLLLGVSIWAFVDFIRILTGGLAPEEGFDR